MNFTPHHAARQMGFRDAGQCPQLGKLALDYLRKTNGYQEKIFAYFENESNAEALYVKLMEELEKCILGYFAFHWDQATFMISQVINCIYFYINTFLRSWPNFF
jgi:hypothetical protein